MIHAAPKDRTYAPKRKKIFFFRGFQLRYSMLVAGSLLVLLCFTGFHALFMIQSYLPPSALATFQPMIQSSTLRLFAVGIVYICVVTMAAIFLSHRTVGPTERIEEELRKMIDSGGASHPIHIREGDEFESLVETINAWVDNVQAKK